MTAPGSGHSHRQEAHPNMPGWCRGICSHLTAPASEHFQGQQAHPSMAALCRGIGAHVAAPGSEDSRHKKAHPSMPGWCRGISSHLTAPGSEDSKGQRAQPRMPGLCREIGARVTAPGSADSKGQRARPCRLALGSCSAVLVGSRPVQVALCYLGRRHHSSVLSGLTTRFGEASHPGPSCDVAPDAPLFRLGAFNPTDLNGKHCLVSSLPPGIYGVSESHLTHRGLGLFRAGLTFAKGPFRYLSGPPVAPRARSSVTGQYSGVGFLSSFPGRTAPHGFEKELWESSHVYLANFYVGTAWLLGAVLYGFPVQPLVTGTMLHAVTERICCNGGGPRFIAGDFNIEPRALSLIPVWKSFGFVEVQDLWHARHGVLPKRTTRKDYLFISPELQELLVDVQVDDTWFADHALLTAAFKAQTCSPPKTCLEGAATCGLAVCQSASRLPDLAPSLDRRP